MSPHAWRGMTAGGTAGSARIRLPTAIALAATRFCPSGSRGKRRSTAICCAHGLTRTYRTTSRPASGPQAPSAINRPRRSIATRSANIATDKQIAERIICLVRSTLLAVPALDHPRLLRSSRAVLSGPRCSGSRRYSQAARRSDRSLDLLLPQLRQSGLGRRLQVCAGRLRAAG